MKMHLKVECVIILTRLLEELVTYAMVKVVQDVLTPESCLERGTSAFFATSKKGTLASARLVTFKTPLASLDV